MAQPWFLDIDHAMRLHRSLIDAYGGVDGLRDVGLLHSALAMPQATFGGEFLHKELVEMAAAYLYHIVQNHPFLDGNKRTGAAAAIVFLAMNDFELEADEESLVTLVLQVACGTLGKPEIVAFFRNHGKDVGSMGEG
jgi:death-on-curing protein